MKGSIRQLSSRSFQLQIFLGIDADGKSKRFFETVRGSKRDAQHRLHELLLSLERGVPMPKGRLNVGELLRLWLDGYVKVQCGPHTREYYRNIVEHHLMPAFEKIQLKNLQAANIQAYYAKACDKLSARTVHKHHRALSQALKYGVKQGYIGRNPCELTDAPKWKGKPMCTMTINEVAELLDALKDNAIYPVSYTAVNTGLRQAELLGLRWRDVNLDTMSISVNQVLYKRRGITEFREPKTSYSRRLVKMTPNLALFLKSYLAGRESLSWQRGIPPKLDDLVFAYPDGKPLDPSMVSHEFTRVARSIGLKDVHFHTCRHTFASIALLKGASPKIISSILGHSSVAFTMSVYAHIIKGMEEEAMALINDAFPTGILKTNYAKITQLSP